jgi:hypothetical protein
MRYFYGLDMVIIDWIGYHLSMDMDMGKNMACHSTGIDGFYSSPRSWILEQGASFVNSGIGGHSFWNSQPLTMIATGGASLER